MHVLKIIFYYRRKAKSKREGEKKGGGMQNLSSLRKPSCERVDDCIEFSRECTGEVALNCSGIQRRVEPKDKSDLWNFKVRFTSLTLLPSALPQQHILQAKNCTHTKKRKILNPNEIEEKKEENPRRNFGIKKNESFIVDGKCHSYTFLLMLFSSHLTT